MIVPPTRAEPETLSATFKAVAKEWLPAPTWAPFAEAVELPVADEAGM